MSRRRMVVLTVLAVGVLVAVAALVVARSNGEWKDKCKGERIKIMGAYEGVERPTDEYMDSVIDKNRALIKERVPERTLVSYGDYKDEDYNLIGGYGITIGVPDLEAYEARPEEERMPECLDGVPVRIIERAEGVPMARSER